MPKEARAPVPLLGLVIVVALIGVAIDQGSKAWAFGAPLGLEGAREVAPGLISGVLARNEGAVAHLASGHSMTAAICALNGLVMLGAGMWWSFRRDMRWRWHDAAFAGLLSAGMLGNSIDRLALGYVRDFLVTEFWPVLIFNLADVFIVTGFLLLLGSWLVTRIDRRAGRAISPTTGTINRNAFDD